MPPPIEVLPEPMNFSDEGKEPYWRGRANDRRAAIAEAEVRVSDLQKRLSALYLDAEPTNLRDPNRMQTRQAEIAKVGDDLAAAQRELAAARKALTDLEEEARRAGALPGWLRER